MNFLITLWAQFLSTLPLFILILLGFLAVKLGRWQKTVTDSLTKFTFYIAFPIMLFQIMSHFSEQSEIDIKLLLVFFGGSFIVFAIGCLIASNVFQLNGSQSTLFAMGGIYTNTVFVGIPIIKMLLGDHAIPIVAMIVIFNALILWTLATVSIEFVQMGKLSGRSFIKALKNVSRNPIIIGIFTGIIVNYLRLPIPNFINQSTKMVSDMTAPLSLIVLGMGLAEYKIRDQLLITGSICILKLVILPIVTYIVGKLLGLPTLELQVVVLLSSVSIAINCYMMARQFEVLQGPIASSLLISTALSSVTTPLILSIMTHLP
ncbi:AEC family transporter [Gilliamella sp. B2776]|uniref:AEC family transporter n=1 Tax=unclassified Gilliamella TaxID=2685620 RepID=UPI002269ECE0|nr:MULTISPECIES: AEC family transporter [unclassified Gilliamella]MCX8649637.1 AEC family transporter [Gilliamella sp. B2779]MCX8665023.1 AEC family transporter [Gilliamella sp. B2887]MCX8654845.1 AEC family transporter [Gilliamella sp. B2737]MCX8691373.1 AEC family transporter [Gilliamella sp. B2776]MCX8702566.1 AEC family transporter [Gilliamella sp. B2781]